MSEVFDANGVSPDERPKYSIFIYRRLHFGSPESKTFDYTNLPSLLEVGLSGNKHGA